MIDSPESRAIRALSREVFLHALAQCSVSRAFSQHVACERGVLRISEDLYDLDRYSDVLVISLGKAGNAMVEALTAAVGQRLSGIAVDIAQPGQLISKFRYFQGGHPTPNAESVEAAHAILRALEHRNANSLVIFMISGGGSSLVEKPINDEISLPDLAQTYSALVHSGAPIAGINAIRKHLSAVKGGRMAQAAVPARQVSILVSDVPDTALDALASGPTMPDSTTVGDCERVVQQCGLLPRFPQSVRELFGAHVLEETPKSDDPAFAHSRWWTVLSNATARNAAAERMREEGFAVEIDNSCDDWDYADAARYLLDRLRHLRSQRSRVCLISGGEVTVKVTQTGGVGGRNQHFALHCATEIAGENIVVLSAGTDGIDGNSPATGAVACGTTVQRAHDAGLDARAALARFDAYTVFDRLGDAITTGPTGTNVRDIRMLLAW